MSTEIMGAASAREAPRTIATATPTRASAPTQLIRSIVSLRLRMPTPFRCGQCFGPCDAESPVGRILPEAFVQTERFFVTTTRKNAVEQGERTGEVGGAGRISSA